MWKHVFTDDQGHQAILDTFATLSTGWEPGKNYLTPGLTPHSKHRFLTPSSKLCQIWLRH